MTRIYGVLLLGLLTVSCCGCAGGTGGFSLFAGPEEYGQNAPVYSSGGALYEGCRKSLEKYGNDDIAFSRTPCAVYMNSFFIGWGMPHLYFAGIDKVVSGESKKRFDEILYSGVEFCDAKFRETFETGGDDKARVYVDFVRRYKPDPGASASGTFADALSLAYPCAVEQLEGMYGYGANIDRGKYAESRKKWASRFGGEANPPLVEGNDFTRDLPPAKGFPSHRGKGALSEEGYYGMCKRGLAKYGENEAEFDKTLCAAHIRGFSDGWGFAFKKFKGLTPSLPEKYRDLRLYGTLICVENHTSVNIARNLVWFGDLYKSKGIIFDPLIYLYRCTAEQLEEFYGVPVDRKKVSEVNEDFKKGLDKMRSREQKTALPQKER